MISDAQLAAGADAINEHLGLGPPIRGFDAWAAAESCYKAMRPLEPMRAPVAERSKSSMTLKLDTSDLEQVVQKFSETVAALIAELRTLPSEDDIPE